MEYFWWLEIVKSQEFERFLKKLSKKLKNKNIIIYCNGLYFDAICDTYDLSKLFNVKYVSDIRYENSQITQYKGFKTLKPSNITKDDYILVATPNFSNIKNFLLKYAKNDKIFSLFYNNDSISSRLIAGIEYFKFTKDLKFFKYFLVCTKEELEIKLNYAKVLKNLKGKSKLRVVFVCEENSKWGYQSLYELMKHNERFEVLPIVLYPIITKGRVEFTQIANKKFFEKYSMPTVDGYDYENNTIIDLKTFSPDLVFYQQPWYLNNINNPKFVSKYALAMMIPYGYTTLNPKFWGSEAVKNIYSKLFMFFSESEYHNKFYKKASKMYLKDNLLATGTPKLDNYLKPINPKVEQLWKGGVKRIVLAHHHSIGQEGLKMGTFNENYKFFMDFAKKHQEYSFVLKPHPALKSACVEKGLMSEKEFDEYIDEWKSLPNGNVYQEGNYLDLFKSSDILITDCSSFLAEYFPSKKPIIFMNRKDRAPFDDFGKKLSKGFYFINKANEIEGILQGKDYLKPVREKLAKKYFNIKGSGKEILNYLQKILSSHS